MEPPSDFRAFLQWLREQTERAWADYRPRTLTDYRAARTSGVDWQRGTRWVPGLWRGRIADIERRWRVRFPPDYRLFLGALHATDRFRIGARFLDGDKLSLTKEPGFYNWETQERELKAAFESPARRVLYSVEHNGLWKESWGPRPRAKRERQALVRDLVRAAPRLIPIIGRRYLLSEPTRTGNIVIAVKAADLVVHAVNLRQCLLTELKDLLPRDIAATETREPDPQFTKALCETPFWGELIKTPQWSD
jgi:hypothetical protein